MHTSVFGEKLKKVLLKVSWLALDAVKVRESSESLIVVRTEI